MNFTIGKFTIDFNYKGTTYRMLVDQVFRSNDVERFMISAGGKAVILQSNRPALRSSGMKTDKITWTVYEGPANWPEPLREAIKIIENKILSIEGQRDHWHRS